MPEDTIRICPEVLHDGVNGCRKDEIMFVSCSGENSKVKNFYCYLCRCLFSVIMDASTETLQEIYPPREGLSFSEKEGA